LLLVKLQHLALCSTPAFDENTLASSEKPKVDMNAANYSTDLMKAICILVTDDEYAIVDYFFTVRHLHRHKRFNMSTSYSFERAFHNRDEEKQKTSDHAQHTVGLYGRNRSGGGNRLSASFHHTRYFPSGRWIGIFVLQVLRKTKEDDNLPLPSIISPFGPPSLFLR